MHRPDFSRFFGFFPRRCQVFGKSRHARRQGIAPLAPNGPNHDARLARAARCHTRPCGALTPGAWLESCLAAVNTLVLRPMREKVSGQQGTKSTWSRSSEGGMVAPHAPQVNLTHRALGPHLLQSPNATSAATVFFSTTAAVRKQRRHR